MRHLLLMHSSRGYQQSNEQAINLLWHTGGTQPLTSHVLDTALGRPAKGVMITLQRAAPGSLGGLTTAGDALSPQSRKHLSIDLFLCLDCTIGMYSRMRLYLDVSIDCSTSTTRCQICHLTCCLSCS